MLPLPRPHSRDLPAQVLPVLGALGLGRLRGPGWHNVCSAQGGELGCASECPRPGISPFSIPGYLPPVSCPCHSPQGQGATSVGPTKLTLQYPLSVAQGREQCLPMVAGGACAVPAAQSALDSHSRVKQNIVELRRPVAVPGEKLFLSCHLLNGGDGNGSESWRNAVFLTGKHVRQKWA